jgi:hypothetical protein
VFAGRRHHIVLRRRACVGSLPSPAPPLSLSRARAHATFAMRAHWLVLTCVHLAVLANEPLVLTYEPELLPDVPQREYQSHTLHPSRDAPPSLPSTPCCYMLDSFAVH